MKFFYKLGVAIVALGTMMSSSWGQVTYNYTGAVQTYVVPAGVTMINIEVFGAQGGTSENDSVSCIIGGLGGYATGDLSVTPGETINIYVGGQGYAGNIGGWNGGGTACPQVTTCAKGGGASDVRQGGTTLSDRVIVGGGGGGAEWSACSGAAGNGGGLTGEDGAHPTTGPRDGRGGTQTAGGAFGTGGYNGTAGTFGVGGDGGLHPSGHSGSGGGGWYGGGGSAEDGHAGGGSSYIDGVMNGSTVSGLRQGDGQVIITALCNTSSSPSVTACETYTVPSGDETYTASGSYMDTIPNAGGCDSIMTIDLTILAASAGSEMVSACDSYTVPSGDETYTTDGTYMDTIPNAVGCDSVITIDLEILNSTTSTDVVTECISYTWIDGNTYTASNNTATHTLTNAVGCDSVITLDLTINTVNIGVTNNSPTLTSDAASATYQWVNCNENYNPITGETNASYTTSSNGDYAVIVTQNGCTDTSACETVDNIGLNNEELSDQISVSPNPSSGQFYVTSSIMIEKITVIDNMGRTVKTIDVNDSKAQVNILDLSKGAYILKIASAQGVVTRNVIKE